MSTFKILICYFINKLCQVSVLKIEMHEYPIFIIFGILPVGSLVSYYEP